MRLLFIDYSSAFNTIVPSKLITKLRTLGLNTSLCNWILDFLTDHHQVVRVGNSICHADPQDRGPSGVRAQSSLFTHDCMAKHSSHTIIKFADDTTVVGLITDNNETSYRDEVRDVAVLFQDNYLSLNVSKTKELIVDYRKRRAEHAPINIDGAVVERGESFKFLAVHSTTVRDSSHQS